MRKQLLSLGGMALLATLASLLGSGQAWAQKGGGGRGGGGHAGGAAHVGGARPSGFSAGARPAVSSGAYHAGAYHSGAGVYHAGAYHAGVYHSGGYYGNAYRPYYAAYRPYAYAYRPYYNNYYSPYFFGSIGLFSPYYGIGVASYPVVSGYSDVYVPPVTTVAQAPPQGTERPPQDDAAHLQLTVPETAQVLIDGTGTTQSGTTREFVTPALTPGARYVYKITVRYTDAKGKVVDDTRDIRFQANDWFGIDFTRPPPGPTPQPIPLPRTGKEE